ncbi:cysteine and histidine-rich protein 1-B [Caerostris extrusa]|uniref:Cysteine and histidine-rich protein 1-B n=1 Tax=Caerostris extrusa TaxID=172846 RepID=A0AAV4VEP5_CAEEX|nr:cysteine and histidine-rich protein 1-B [Caerostris extrusa]
MADDVSHSGDARNLIDSFSDEMDNQFRAKKLKLSVEAEPLEERLHQILCCAVCLDLPKSAVYQCRNGHLMCLECFNHLLADAHLKMAPSACPSCRIPINKDSCVRNLVVEKAVSELPITCNDCSLEFPRSSQEVHEKQLCQERFSFCTFYRIGCFWSGPYKKKADHEKRCAQPKKNGQEIKQLLPDIFSSAKSSNRKHLCDYLSFEKIAYNDLQFIGPYRTDEFYVRFETFRFCAFGMGGNYALLLKESVHRTIHMHYTIVKVP